MLYQAISWNRFVPIFITQQIVAYIFVYLAYKILKRNKKILNILLSSYYIFVGTASIFNVIFIIISINPVQNLLYLTYFIDLFLFLFSQVFILIFILNLVGSEEKFSSKKQLTLIIFHFIICFLLLFIPNGINISIETNWTPVYSWTFFIIVNIYFTSLIFIPIFFLLISLYKNFEDKNLKTKLRYFILGIVGLTVSFYGFFLFNTWHDSVFRIIWPFLSIIIIPSALSIYYGLGKDL
ncbi:MAG: hypothetical protein EU518_02040 [Promethearchaeota archaeon]|nr:MAG: hypothetical protein EU518_02040 [Candidatus Lokiarchaeota archaeon]